MPISFTPISDKTNWSGAVWTVSDDAELAYLIATVALGQARHVARILQKTGCETLTASTTLLQGTRKLLEVPLGTEPFHRDGWLFQVISWIASHCQNPGALIRSPQMIWADKGFDGLYLLIDTQQHSISSAVVCEDKATTNARRRIANDVWPALKEMETGARDNELLAAVTSLLEGQENADQVVADVFWKRVRAYRVSVTSASTGTPPKGLSRLFDGFEKIVPGALVRRRAEVLALDDIRGWLDSIANQALEYLGRLETGRV